MGVISVPARTKLSWYQSWMGWATTIAILVIGAAIAWGTTNERLDATCTRVTTIEAKVDKIAEDSAYTRGRIETALGEHD